MINLRSVLGRVYTFGLLALVASAAARASNASPLPVDGPEPPTSVCKLGSADFSAPAGSHLTYYGGRVISNAEIVEVLWGVGSYIPQVTATLTPSIATFYQQVLNSAYMDWLTEYNTTVAGGTLQQIGHGYFKQQVLITPSVGSSTVTDAQIQTELLAQIAAGHLPLPTVDAGGNVNTIYMIYFPHGKTIIQGGSSSCVGGGFCAYHGTLVRGGQHLYYGVMPDMQAGSGCDTGCGAGTTFANEMSVSSHELIEAITDAEVGLATVVGPPLAWYDATNGEIGDICNAQQGTILGADGQTYTVQKEFSNVANDCIVALTCQNDGQCNDHNACTADSCNSGTCVHANNAGACDDANVCTTDTCDPVAGCVHTNNGNACNDGNACTTGDTCGGGLCTGVPVLCNDANVCTTDTCDAASGCVYTNNGNACDDGDACTVGDTCRGGVCGGGTSAPTEHILNGGFETGAGLTGCGPNPFLRDSWTGSGSAIQLSGCGWTGATITASLGFPGGGSPGTLSQTFAATAGPGTLIYDHGSHQSSGSCSYTVTFGPSNTVVPVTLAPAVGGLVAAASVAVPAGTTSVTFGNVSCAGGVQLIQFDNVSLMAGVATFHDCNDGNVCTDDSCNPASGCVHTNNAIACNDGNACTIGDSCRGGVCGGGTTDPLENLANGGFETGAGGTGCGPYPFQRDSWTGTGSAVEHSGCAWSGASVTVSLGYPGGSSPGTISQVFPATPGPGTLSYLHGGWAPSTCSYTVTLGPSNTVISVVNVSLPGGLTAAATIAVPAGTTSVTFGGVSCTGTELLQFDDVSLTAGVATFIDCNDNNVCTTDICNQAIGCIYSANANPCDDGNPCTAGDTCSNFACAAGTTITAPPEAQNLRFAADKSTISWSPLAIATQYDAVRGSISGLPVGPGGGDEACANDLAGPVVGDGSVPVPGSGFWYLSRGENACGIGTYGTQGIHGVPGAPRITTSCP